MEITKKELREKVKNILKEDPTILYAIKTSLFDQELNKIAINIDPSFISKIQNPNFELCKFVIERDPKTIKRIPYKFQKILRVRAIKADNSLREFFYDLSDDEISEIERS